jgi:hypothetical protein
VAGCCEYGDEPLGSGTTELVRTVVGFNPFQLKLILVVKENCFSCKYAEINFLNMDSPKFTFF